MDDYTNHDYSYSRPLIDSTNKQTYSTARRKPASIFIKATPLLLATISTVLAVLAYLADEFSWYITAKNPAFYFILYDRPTVQTILHIVASILGFVWTFAVFTAFNLTARGMLESKSVSLDTLRLYTAISRKSFDLCLSKRFFGISLAAFVLTMLPSWLWTGALAPSLATRTATYTVLMPGQATNYPDPLRETCLQAIWRNTTFNNCPGVYDVAGLTQTMKEAASIQGIYRNHQKWDNTGYVYLGRSYGAGAGIGFSNTTISIDMNRTSFQQAAFVTTVTCKMNDTLNWKIVKSDQPDPTDGRGHGYFAEGYRSFQNWSQRTQYTMETWDTKGANIVAFSTDGVANMPPYVLAIAANSDYSSINGIECMLDIAPAMVNVNVTIADNSIEVTPVIGDQSKDLDPQYMQRVRALANLQYMTQGVGYYRGNPIGDALTKGISEDVMLDRLSAAFEAVLDDIFMIYSAYAVSMGDAEEQPAEFLLNVFALGSRKYHVALLVLNVIGFFIVLGTMFWTKFYAHSPAFDFSDCCAILTAAHVGAKTKAETMTEAAELASWNGDPTSSWLKHSHWMIDSRLGMYGAPKLALRPESMEYEMSKTT